MCVVWNMRRVHVLGCDGEDDPKAKQAQPIHRLLEAKTTSCKYFAVHILTHGVDFLEM